MPILPFGWGRGTEPRITYGRNKQYSLFIHADHNIPIDSSKQPQTAPLSIVPAVGARRPPARRTARYKCHAADPSGWTLFMGW